MARVCNLKRKTVSDVIDHLAELRTTQKLQKCLPWGQLSIDGMVVTILAFAQVRVPTGGLQQ